MLPLADGERQFVVVTGLPGSGKSCLAKRIAPLLGLDVIDKDDILEDLFRSKGIGDEAWRRTLSRESDGILEREVRGSQGAVLVSFWHLPGMSRDSGTPTGWLRELSGTIVNLHCECPAELAAHRFGARERHAGHLDHTRSPEQIVTSIRDVARLERLQIGETVCVDTSTEIRIEQLAERVRSAFDRAKDSRNRLHEPHDDQQ
jgi:gluconate kinase